jgi:ferritin-like metal-binding protein YciE
MSKQDAIPSDPLPSRQGARCAALRLLLLIRGSFTPDNLRSTTEFFMQNTSLQDLFIQELKDLYNAENQLVKALPKMAKAATDPELQRAFTDHLKETTNQVSRLEKIFANLEVSPKGKKCKAMEGLILEGKEAMEEYEDDTIRDAALIAAAQRVEHYEIAGYGCVRTFAKLLGNDEAAELLQETLDEEGNADKLLTSIAENINVEAVEKDQESDEGDGEEEESKMAHAGNGRR